VVVELLAAFGLDESFDLSSKDSTRQHPLDASLLYTDLALLGSGSSGGGWG
jgi:hypothetical protein